MTGIKVFLSYSHIDIFSATTIVDMFEASSYTIWWDKNIPESSDWETVLAEQIQECQIFMFLASERSLSSENCLREYNYAVSKKKQFVLALLHPNVPVPIETMGRVQGINLYDLKGNYDRFSTIQSALQNSEKLDPTKHSLKLPQDKAFGNTLDALIQIVNEIMEERKNRGNNIAGKRQDRLGIQLCTIYEIVDDKDELNPHVQHFSSMLNDGNVTTSSLEIQAKKVLKRIEELRNYIKSPLYEISANPKPTVLDCGK